MKAKDEIERLILRIAPDNPSWDYTRIQGARKNLGYKVSRGAIANILKLKGVHPAPLNGKRTPWRTFLKAHWKRLIASDFFTIEVWGLQSLTICYVL